MDRKTAWLNRIAHHEAGHAIATAAVTRSPATATIWPAKNTRFDHDAWEGEARLASHLGPYPSPEAAALVAVSGPLAEVRQSFPSATYDEIARFLSLHWFGHIPSDMDRALAGDGWQDAIGPATSLIFANWPQVQRLAQALIHAATADTERLGHVSYCPETGVIMEATSQEYLQAAIELGEIIDNPAPDYVTCWPPVSIGIQC